MVLICISSSNNDVEFFMCLFVCVCMYTYENVYLSLLSISKLYVFLLNCRSSSYVIDINPFLDIWFSKYFLPFCEVYFHSFHSVFWYMKVLNFNKVQFICFFFYNLCFVIIFKKPLLNPKLWRFSYISFKSFIVLGLKCRYWTHFNFSHDITEESNFIGLHVDIQFS